MNDPHGTPLDHQRLLRQAMSQTATGPATAPAAPSVEELAQRFPDHEVLELIGRGGMGAVYKARQRNLQRLVAIKVLPTELASDPEFGERFLREARALATLNHPSILTVHDFGERDGMFFLTTEFVDGVNLRQLMELGELSPAEALRIAPQICTALQFAHERGVVHRDIKPENILIDADGQVKIADFGLAKVARPGDQVELTRQTAVLGTPHYMAPEQWRGTANVDHRADIYSLGVVLYEMLTGELPIGHFDPPSQRGGVPRGLDQVVRRALAQQPEKRYQQARDVQSDVEHEAQNLGIGPAPKDDGGVRGPLIKAPIVALAAVLLAVVAIGYLIFLTEQQRRTEHRFETEMARYDVTTEAAAQVVRAGAELPALQAMPAAPPDPAISIDAARAMVGGVAFGTILLVLALGWGALRSIRNGSQPRRGVGLAVFTAWLVPLGIADTIAFVPVAAIRGNDLQVIAGIIVGGLLAVGNVWFLILQARGQRALVQQGVRMPAGRAWIATTAVLAIAVFAATALMPKLLPQQLADYRLSRAPTHPQDLVGQPRSFVLARLGPPQAITVSANSESWSYDNARQQQVDQALAFSGDYVLAYDRNTIVLMPNNKVTVGPTIGQSIDEFVRAYGPPIDRRDGGLVMKCTFANGFTVTVRNGIVVGHER